MHYQNGTYYLYYTISQIRTQNSQIGVATSPTMDPGSWIDHGIVGIPANTAYNRIDPNSIQIGDKQYLNFGSYWHGLYQIEMESPLKAGSTTPHNIAHKETGLTSQEAAFVFEYKGWLYLLFSLGVSGSYTATYPPPDQEYRIQMCRSKTGTGDFVSTIMISIT